MRGLTLYELKRRLQKAGLRVVDSKHHSPGGDAAVGKLFDLLRDIDKETP